MLRTSHEERPNSSASLLLYSQALLSSFDLDRQFQDLILFPTDVSKKVQANLRKAVGKIGSHSTGYLLETFI